MANHFLWVFISLWHRSVFCRDHGMVTVDVVVVVVGRWSFWHLHDPDLHRCFERGWQSEQDYLGPLPGCGPLRLRAQSRARGKTNTRLVMAAFWMRLKDSVVFHSFALPLMLRLQGESEGYSVVCDFLIPSPGRYVKI